MCDPARDWLPPQPNTSGPLQEQPDDHPRLDPVPHKTRRPSSKRQLYRHPSPLDRRTHKTDPPQSREQPTQTHTPSIGPTQGPDTPCPRRQPHHCPPRRSWSTPVPTSTQVGTVPARSRVCPLAHSFAADADGTGCEGDLAAGDGCPTVDAAPFEGLPPDVTEV